MEEDNITVTANFVNKVYKAKIVIKGLPAVTATAAAAAEAPVVETGTGETATTVTTPTPTPTPTADPTANLIQVMGADGKYKAVQNNSTIDVVFDSNLYIGLTSAGSGYEIVNYKITSAVNPSQALIDTKCNCNDFNYYVTKDGIAEITITLKAK